MVCHSARREKVTSPADLPPGVPRGSQTQLSPPTATAWEPPSLSCRLQRAAARDTTTTAMGNARLSPTEPTPPLPAPALSLPAQLCPTPLPPPPPPRRRSFSSNLDRQRPRFVSCDLGGIEKTTSGHFLPRLHSALFPADSEAVPTRQDDRKNRGSVVEAQGSGGHKSR